MYRYLFLLLLPFLAGCAVMDISTVDTAVPLKKNGIKIQNYTGGGLMLNTAIRNPADYSDEPDVNDEEVRTADLAAINVFKANVGITDKLEAGAKYWSWDSGVGGKGLLKYNFYHNKSLYMSVQPALSYMLTLEPDNNNHDYLDAPLDSLEFTAAGAETTLLITAQIAPWLSCTLAPHLNYENFQYQFRKHDFLAKRGPYNLVHGGINGNFNYKFGFLVLTHEVGLEVVPVKNGNITLLPNFAGSIGVQFE